MRTGTGEAGAVGLSYGRQRLFLVQAVAQAAQGWSKGDSGKDWGGEEMV